MQPMKRTFRSAIWPLLGLLTVACAAPDGRNLPAAEDFESLSAQFAAPSKEYGSAPLFVWNKVVTPERIDEAMADLKDKGFGGVFVHPRPGMVTQYLDDNWFSLFRHTMEKGRELDMNVWIYDENSYPSGFAGGHVNEAMPESYDEGVALKYLRAGVLPDTVDRFFCCLRREGDAFTDITAEAVSRRGEKGDYYLFYKAYNPTSPWYSGFSYVDLMHEGVADKFIELTLDGYKKVVGEEFGGTVPGWFTDEPQIVVTDRESIRWTPDLFDAFRARWGYDLEPNLVSLWEEVGPWRQVRHNYRDVLMNLFLDRYIKVCHDYCERNNLVFTGHFWEHGWPDMGHNPDNMAMYAWQQMPGIDLLYNKFDVESPNAHFGNVRSVKEVNSAANQMGRVRKLSESYGGGGWDMTLRDFKRQGDWEYALGVNFMNQHIAPLSIAGARKYDYPPAFTPHSPWWEYYRELNLHFARLSLALSSGGQYNDVLVLEPTTSIWMYYTYNAPRPNRWRTMGEEFQAFITALERHQVEFDLGSENILLNHGSVKGDRFVVGKRAYGTVVLPAQMENVDAATFDLLERFAAKGGRIIAYGTPQYVDGARSAEAEAFFADPAKVTRADAGEPIDYSLFATPEIAFDAPEGNYLFHHRRRMDDGQLLFLANLSLTRPVRGTVTLQGRQAALLDTRTGEIRGYEAQREGDRLTIAYDLHPAGSLLLYVFDEEREGLAPAPARRVLTAVPAAGGLTAKPDAPNVMTIDFCDLELDGKVYPDLNSYDAAKLAYQHHGFKAGNPWSTSVQFRDHTVRDGRIQGVVPVHGDVRCRPQPLAGRRRAARTLPRDAQRRGAESPARQALDRSRNAFHAPRRCRAHGRERADDGVLADARAGRDRTDLYPGRFPARTGRQRVEHRRSGRFRRRQLEGAGLALLSRQGDLCAGVRCRRKGALLRSGAGRVEGYGLRGARQRPFGRYRLCGAVYGRRDGVDRGGPQPCGGEGRGQQLQPHGAAARRALQTDHAGLLARGQGVSLR